MTGHRDPLEPGVTGVDDADQPGGDRAGSAGAIGEDHVLRVLNGTPLAQVAADARTAPATLAAAIETYRSAGRAALADSPRWLQLRLRFARWDTAEDLAAEHLGPHLDRRTADAAITSWWFLRKYPNWRLRILPHPDAGTAAARQLLAPTLDDLVDRRILQRWWTTVYEPETLAFGGHTAMGIAHTLFHADSSHLLRCRRHLRADTPTTGHDDTAASRAVGRRELSILLCTALFRAARLDGHEQGDTWNRVAQTRAAPAPGDHLLAAADTIRPLVTADTSPGGPLTNQNGPVRFATEWLAAFTDAGARLADAARDGTLERGLRDVLANHVIFHWNRLGLSLSHQSQLAWAAREALLPTRSST